jgi:hypothetical protein
MKKIFILMFLAVSSIAALSRADQGTTAASFLKLGTGARVIALAESFAGLADDANAIQYNASGLAFVDQKQVTLMHAVWFEDIFYDNIALAWPLENIGTIGLNLFYLNAGDFEKWELDGGGNPVNRGNFTAGSLYAGLAFARKIVPDISAGLYLKFVSETIDGMGTGAIAVDLSSYWQTPIKGLSAGINIQNLGPQMGFEEAFSLPINFRIGLGYKPLKNVALGLDYTQPIETYGILSAGAEYGYRDFMFMRIGYKYQGMIDVNRTYTGFGPAVAAGLSLGMGFLFMESYSLDYAYTPHGFLGTGHRFSLSARFK